MDATINLRVNGHPHAIVSDGDRPLLDVLREDLRLCGTKYGCGEGECGACSVLIDGKRAFSCRTPVATASDKAIETIEGLAHGQTLHPVQQAFLDEGAFQCAYCTSGMIIAAVALLKANPNPTDEQIVAGLNGNICRCCSYPRILAAVQKVARSAGGERHVP